MPEASDPTGDRQRQRAERQTRLAQALRDNLRRRKQQARARQLPQPKEAKRPPSG